MTKHTIKALPLIGMLLTGCAAATLALPASAQTPAASASAPASAADAQFDAVLADYEAYQASQNPFEAARRGDKAALHALPNPSLEASLARIAPLEALKARLDGVDSAQLDDDRRTNHALLGFEIQRQLDLIPLDTGRMAFNSEGGPGQSLGYMLGYTRITNAEEAEGYLSRLNAAPAYYQAEMENVRRGVATGLVQPRSVVEFALVLAEADLAPPAGEPLLRPLDNLPATLTSAQQEQVRARAKTTIDGPLREARKQWRDMLKNELLPTAPEAPGIVHRPGGKEIYAALVRDYTTTNLTPDEVHAIGQAEVARIRALMQEEMRAAGWTGDFAGFLNYLRTDPKFYATSREELMEKASEMAKRADGGLPKLFWTLPRLPYAVTPVAIEIEEGYTTGRYSPGSHEMGRAGEYWVNTGKLDQRPLYELPALTLHEAVPGHHLQIALQQEAAAQPAFRRNANLSAFTEGWGLYSEFLGEEMGFYRTPYERFGRLSYEMWRACRLVADTGIHWLGWTTEEARACFRDNSALSMHNIETELQRYIGWPGQATAYKIGEIRLKDIRKRAEAAHGPAFNVRHFHDALLVDGPLPLDMLDQRMNVWIEANKPKAD